MINNRRNMIFDNLEKNWDDIDEKLRYSIFKNNKQVIKIEHKRELILNNFPNVRKVIENNPNDNFYPSLNKEETKAFYEAYQLDIAIYNIELKEFYFKGYNFKK